MEHNNNVSTHSQLPSVKALVEESWNRFVASIGGLFFMNVLTSLITCLTAGIIAVLVVLVLVVLHSVLSALIAAVLGIVALVVLIYVGTAGSVAQIQIIAASPKKEKTMEVFKSSFTFVVPLLLTGFISSLLITGTFFLFFFPALIFSFFFMFTNVAVVLDGKKYREALRYSSALVGEFFGEVLVRVLLLAGMYLVGMVFIPEVVRRVAPGTGVILSLYMALINILMSWFSLSYFVTMYQHVKAHVSPNHKGSLMPAAIVSGIGWFLVVALTVLAVTLVPWKDIQKAAKTNGSRMYTVPTPSSLQQKEINDLYQQLQKASQESKTMR